MATTIQRLADIITPIVTDLGLELFDLEYTSSTVRVTIDKAPVDGEPGVIDLSDITAVTRSVSRALDEHDPIVDQYSLEVSSPGLERTLRTPRHFERAVDQIVSIKTVPNAELDRRITGTLVAAPPTGPIELRLDTGEVCTIAYADIDKARTVFAWGPEPRPEKTKTKPPATTKASSKVPSGAADADSDAAQTMPPRQPKKKVKPS